MYKMIQRWYIIPNHLSTTLWCCSLNKARRQWWVASVAFGLTSRCGADTKPSRASSSGQVTATQFVVVASILPPLSSVYTELMAKDACGNFLWETLVRDGLNDAPRMRSRWWENKRQDGERRPRSPLPLPSSYLPPSLPHSLSGPIIVTTWFFFFTCRSLPVLPAKTKGSRFSGV